MAGEREWLAKAPFVLIGLVLSELVVSQTGKQTAHWCQVALEEEGACVLLKLR